MPISNASLSFPRVGDSQESLNSGSSDNQKAVYAEENSAVNDLWTNMLTSNVQILRPGEQSVNFSFNSTYSERKQDGKNIYIGGLKEISFEDYHKRKEAELRLLSLKEFVSKEIKQETTQQEMETQSIEAKTAFDNFEGGNIKQTWTIIKENVDVFGLLKFIGGLFKGMFKATATTIVEGFKPQKEEPKDKKDAKKPVFPTFQLRFISDIQKAIRKSKIDEVNPFYFMNPTSYENLVDENGNISIHAVRPIERAKKELEEKKKQKESAVSKGVGKGKLSKGQILTNMNYATENDDHVTKQKG